MSGNWRACYRLQLHAGFPLSQAQEVLPYLAQLGISHVYLSPCLQAVPGSQHGYDVADPARVSQDLGGEPAWDAFVQAAREQSLKILLDIVPNHMSASEHNPWWESVLTHGPFSEFAGYFDFRNSPDRPFRVHLSSLAQPFGAALLAGELTLEVVRGRVRLRHYDNTWPLSPSSWGALLSGAEASGSGARGVDAQGEEAFAELERLQDVPRPDERQRAAYARHAARPAAGDGQPHRGRQGVAGRGAAPPVLRAARLEARRRTRQLPAILRCRHFERDPHRSAGGFQRVACANRGNDRA
jgi:maltooligosyltrehalose synthase